MLEVIKWFIGAESVHRSEEVIKQRINRGEEKDKKEERKED